MVQGADAAAAAEEDDLLDSCRFDLDDEPPATKEDKAENKSQKRKTWKSKITLKRYCQTYIRLLPNPYQATLTLFALSRLTARNPS